MSELRNLFGWLRRFVPQERSPGEPQQERIPLLITMRLADMLRVHPKQNNDHCCSECGSVVGIYPSGQAALRRYPNIKIVCQQCQPPGGGAVLAPGAIDEGQQSIWATGRPPP